MTVATDYLVWSNEHRAWWRPGAQGYTRIRDEAGRYSREQALHICAGANRFHGIGEAPNEVPVPLVDALETVGPQTARCRWCTKAVNQPHYAGCDYGSLTSITVQTDQTGPYLFGPLAVLQRMREWDDESGGSLPEWYRKQIDAALGVSK